MQNLYVIAGPNGAGKTTVALRLLPDFLQCNEFVNADFIAKGLSAFNTESVAVAAGRLMLERLNELKEQKKDFAFETTLSSKSFVPFLKECKEDGYFITLIYIWIESAELAIERIQNRVREGGHFIPDDVVRRRYERSVQNFVNLYLPIVDKWKIYDNTFNKMHIVALKENSELINILLSKQMKKNMTYKVEEPKQEYIADKIDIGVKTAIAEELERKRKLGLPIVFGKDGKIIVMIGDRVVEERVYEKKL
ncbi:MAG: zeta toxin family protein [Ignavibacteriales bacterium]|nr:zeta toxin family protein [Ignavibacteriales bacterium]